MSQRIRKASALLRRRAHSSSDAAEQVEDHGRELRGVLKDRYRVVVMGAAGVGKTCIIQRFLYEQFSAQYKATVEELHHGYYEVNGSTMTLDILDTTGAYAFPAMRKLSISTADAFVLVYSINDKDSFEEVRNLRDQILELRCDPACKSVKEEEEEKDNDLLAEEEDIDFGNDASICPPIVIVGNKVDLTDDARVVPRHAIDAQVSIEWQNGYVETSAKDNININGVFKELLSQAHVRLETSPMLVRKRRQSLPTNTSRRNRKDSCKMS